MPEQQTSKKNLYSFSWKGGGWNQVRADSEGDAISEIASQFSSCDLKPDLETLKLVTDTKAYWNDSRWID